MRPPKGYLLAMRPYRSSTAFSDLGAWGKASRLWSQHGVADSSTWSDKSTMGGSWQTS